ncbi:MAG: type II toxin-antitoxin system HicB family antitoxin [Chloroflexota bacterium]|nr:type II toxin-antitoxin system HicB family antitoxin [Chloroflexota bacterium]
MGKRRFTALVWQEGDWWVAQAVEVNVASQSRSKEEARSNLREALELHFEPKMYNPPKVTGR